MVILNFCKKAVCFTIRKSNKSNIRLRTTWIGTVPESCHTHYIKRQYQVLVIFITVSKHFNANGSVIVVLKNCTIIPCVNFANYSINISTSVPIFIYHKFNLLVFWDSPYNFLIICVCSSIKHRSHISNHPFTKNRFGRLPQDIGTNF